MSKPWTQITCKKEIQFYRSADKKEVLKRTRWTMMFGLGVGRNETGGRTFMQREQHEQKERR